DVLPWSFSFALLKGRNNYLCLDRLTESEAAGRLHGLFDDQQRQLDEVLAWADQTQRGDVSELPFIPSAQVWSRFSVSSDECKADACSFRDECFAECAKAKAQEADIVVTNYHMLFAHLAVRRETGQDLVLPPFDLLVLDEAHEAAEIARDFFGFSVSRFTIARLANAAADFGKQRLGDTLRREAETLFDRLADYERSPSYRRRLRVPGVVTDAGLQKTLVVLQAAAEERADDSSLEKKDRARASSVARAASTASARLTE